MSVEQQVDALATSVDELKAAVVTKKATLDASVVDAQSATTQAQAAKANTLSARDQAGAFKDAAYTAAQSAASAVAYQDLTAIAATKAETAVDVFIYDTSKDSDGGAWRHRCAGTSWYREELNTATRGSRREFPAVVVIVAEANRVTIYDGDDPMLPMWRVEMYAGLTIKALAALNASISVATTVGLIVSDYAGDDLGTTAPGYTTATTPAIVDNIVRDVAMMVLPDAPIDAATGLPVPTIAVATADGVSVIKDDGSVFDITFSGGWGSNITNIQIANGNLYFQQSIHFWLKIPLAAMTQDYVIAGYGFSAGLPFTQMQLNGNSFTTCCGVAAENSVFELAYPFGSTSGWGMLLARRDNSSMFYRLHRDYISGWIIGSARGSFLGDKNDADLVGDGSLTTPTRAGGGALLVFGTITREPVVTGAELIAYSGFSEVNYLEGTHETYADMLYALGWVQTAGVWEFKHGVVSAAPIDGLTITGTTLKIAGTKPKALVRITATTPTTAQLAKIQADERFLFQENAACTFYGASDAVTALAHDPDTGLLHVGTSAGRSVFQGLRRMANTTVPVTTAIAAAGGMVVDE